MIGPFIPEHLLKSKREEQNDKEEQLQEDSVAVPDDEEVDIDAYAPELPPDMIQPKPAAEFTSKRRRAPIGPSLPSGPSHKYEEEDEEVIGPVIPSGNIMVSATTLRWRNTLCILTAL
jgi:hypothetical protein